MEAAAVDRRNQSSSGKSAHQAKTFPGLCSLEDLLGCKLMLSSKNKPVCFRYDAMVIASWTNGPLRLQWNWWRRRCAGRKGRSFAFNNAPTHDVKSLGDYQGDISCKPCFAFFISITSLFLSVQLQPPVSHSNKDLKKGFPGHWNCVSITTDCCITITFINLIKLHHIHI